MHLEQNGADRNHKNCEIDKELHRPVLIVSVSERGNHQPGSGAETVQAGRIIGTKFLCLLRAQPARAIARLICAIRRTERMRIGRRTRVHVAADRRLRRVGRFAGCSLSCGAGRCRRIDAPWRGQVGRNNRRADGRRRRRRRRDRQRRNRRCRCGHTRRGGCTQARFRISHRRHWCRQPIEPQQHAAKSNRRHGAVGYKSHRFALGTKDNTQEAP